MRDRYSSSRPKPRWLALTPRHTEREKEERKKEREREGEREREKKEEERENEVKFSSLPPFLCGCVFI